jgi:hypothetical protein
MASDAERVQVEGLDALLKTLDGLPEEMLDEAEDAVDKSVKLLAADAADYPPQRSGSNYRRTGTLGRRWGSKVERRGSRINALADNPTSYGSEVMGPDDQAEVHKGRWRTTTQVLLDNLEKINRILLEAANRLDEFLGRGG